MLRPLKPSAIKLMLHLEHVQPQQAALAPHAYLLRDLLRCIRLHMMPHASTASPPNTAPIADSDMGGEQLLLTPARCQIVGVVHRAEGCLPKQSGRPQSGKSRGCCKFVRPTSGHSCTLPWRLLLNIQARCDLLPCQARHLCSHLAAHSIAISTHLLHYRSDTIPWGRDAARQ